MKKIAIIPARGGSKRLPRKNIVDFLGKPIIAYTIEAALESRLFDKVVVSTEDSEIASIAKSYGASVAIRPEALATDKARVLDVCVHLLETEMQVGAIYAILTCLYATSPLRNAEDIRATLSLIEPGVCDFAMAVTQYTHPPHQALKFSDNRTLEAMWPDLIEKKSQEIGSLVVDNGSTYCVMTEALRMHKTWYGPGLRGHQMPFERSIDIDIESDLEMAKIFVRKSNLF